MILHVRFVAAIAALLLSLGVFAQQKFEPQVGQAGKDVIWVPTPDEVVERMLTMAQVTPNDIHFDLGAGVRRDFTGRVNGTLMEGSFRDEKGGEGRWSATKK